MSAVGLTRSLRSTPLGIAIAVSALHSLNDAYTSFLPPLLPRIMGKLDLSITLAAGLMTALALGSSLAQPLMGRLADRRGRRALVVLGPMATGTFLSMMGLAPGFWTLVLLLALGGLGSAAFHPPGASLAARVGQGGRSGMRHAIFSFCGATGHALGPVAVVWLISRVGFDGMWIAMLPVLVLGAALWFVLPPGSSDRILEPPPSMRELGRILRGPLGLVFGISCTTAFLNSVFLTFQPIVMAAEGASEVRGAVVISVYLAGQAMGTLLGGYLTDRMERPRLLAILTAIAFPLFVATFLLPGGSALSFAAVALAGACNMAVLPPIVIMAIELSPSFVSTSSGIVMGLAWATAALAVIPAGIVGDMLGPQAAAIVLTPAVLIGTWFASRPKLRRHSWAIAEE
ncbi:MAG TPA: MFS transporter [Gemmatimonadota bacterium]|jgi:FSR family fosmidomycin resistance protein-like MFS transporter|nr:MFS transporter [Gemmatimonadota bacterium]